MAKKDSSQYLVQAYQSPYTQQLFALNDKAEFDSHLRQQERIERDRIAAANANAQRMNIWSTLRNACTCLEDLPPLLKALPPELDPYYRKRATFKSGGDDGWNLTPNEAPRLGLQSITHASPLGQSTNFAGMNKTGPTNVLGLRGTALENLNYNFSESKRESGISTCNNEFVLFADDWPFVAKMALRAAFSKQLQIPSKYRPSNKTEGTIEPNYTRFWEDLNKYSLQYVGMEYVELQGMRDNLGLTVNDLNSMMSLHEKGAEHAQIELPAGLEHDTMQGLGG